jgi:hypothetical protein
MLIRAFLFILTSLLCWFFETQFLRHTITLNHFRINALNLGIFSRNNSLAVRLRLGYDIKDHRFTTSSLHKTGLKSKVITFTSFTFLFLRPFMSQYVFKQMTILFAFLLLLFQRKGIAGLVYEFENYPYTSRNWLGNFDKFHIQHSFLEKALLLQ